MAKLSDKAVQTREDLLKAALHIFSEKWYDSVSVSDISNCAGRSNGAFYNYFKNKKEIFLALLDLFLDTFNTSLEKISGDSIETRLESFLTITIEAGRDNKKLVTIFREGQYRFSDREQKLRDIYFSALNKVYGRSLSEAEYLFVIGPLRFISIRNLYHQRPYDKETLKNFITGGLFPDCDFDSSLVFAPIEDIESTRQENTKNILLLKAVQLFGESGYHKVNVYDITRGSSFAVGTFYRHFESKETILRELVEKIGRETRHLISLNLHAGLNPLERTIRGFYVFTRHMEKNPAYYTIVREAEFVVEKSVEEYYNNFEKGYVKHSVPGRLDVVTIANSLSGLGHYFGIEDIFSRNIQRIEESLSILATYLKSGLAR